MEGKTMGNGNNTAYAEIVIKTCTEQTKEVPFKEPVFRESRGKANVVLAALSLQAMGGGTISSMMGTAALELEGLPGTAHIVELTLNKCNIESGKAKLVTTRLYDCEHTRSHA